MTTIKIPTSTKEYLSWHSGVLNENIPSKSHYNAITGEIFSILSSFKDHFKSQRNVYEQEFHQKKGCSLFSKETNDDLCIKPYRSYLSKLLRKNVKNKEEKNDYIKYKGSFSVLKDIFRTTIVVKYLDGIDFLYEKLLKFETNCELKTIVEYENREEGYYALHCNIPHKINATFEEISCDKIIWIEVQVTTQFQEVLKHLLHERYEQTREEGYGDSIVTKNNNWKWDYNSKEFTINYMAHTLHFMEGLIVKNRK